MFEPARKIWYCDKTKLCESQSICENMEPFELEGEGLLARAICHECEHLEGVMYVEHVEAS